MMSHHLSPTVDALLPKHNLDMSASDEQQASSTSPQPHHHQDHRQDHHHPHPALLQQRSDSTDGLSKLAIVRHNEGATKASNPQVGLSRVDSSGSIHSLGGTSSKTASFFASSPILKTTSTSRPFVTSGHVRSGSSSSLQSMSAVSSQLLPPASLHRSPSSSSTVSTHHTTLAEQHLPESMENSRKSAQSQGARSHHQQGRRPSSFRSAAIQLSSPSDYYNTSALSSAGSICSRRNWDDFEGKAITPLPSPGIGQYEMESRHSMFGGGAALGPHDVGTYNETGAGGFSECAWDRLQSPDSKTSVVAGDDLPSVQHSAFLAAPDIDTNGREFSRRNLPSSIAKDGLEPTASDGVALRSTDTATRSVSKTKSFFATSHTPIPPIRTPVKAGDQAGHSRNISSQSGNSSTSWESPLGSANSVQSPWLALRYQSNDTSRSHDSLSVAEDLHHLTTPPTSLWGRRPVPVQKDSCSPSQMRAELKQPMFRNGASSDHIESSTRPQDSPLDDAGKSIAPPLSRESIQSGSPSSPQGQMQPQGQEPPDALPRSSPQRRFLGPSERISISSLAPLNTSKNAAVQGHSMEDLAPSPILASAFAPAELLTIRSELVSSADLAPLNASTDMLGPQGRSLSGTLLHDNPGKDESEDEATSRVGRYRVEKTLGVGAFSRVVLATPIFPELTVPPLPRAQSTAPSPSISDDSRALPADDDGLGKEKEAVASRRKALQWPRPWRRSSSSHLTVDTALRSPSRGFRSRRTMSTLSQTSESLQASFGDQIRSTSPQTELADAAKSTSGSLAALDGECEELPRLVALKMIQREPCDQNERMRVSWVREVEVLKHIEHPSLITFVNAFSTPRHHVLVLERVAGGELFDLLSAHHSKLARREWLVRRLFAELANAVGWMHSIHLVHRDIKLENIILTRHLFATMPSSSPLELTPSDTGPVPLLKLTDFGLSRFIDPTKALLETRCGSEEYAAPELIIGKKYDGRKTDCWAMGVVLYSLICGGLPFVEGSPGTATSASSLALGGIAGSNSSSVNLQMVTNQNTREDHRGVAEGQQADSQRDARKRKAHLLRIAKGDLRWPSKTNDESLDVPPATLCPPNNRLVTPFAKHIVARLLRRDANKRGSAWECFEDPWLSHGSFLSTEGGEYTARGQTVELPPDPRTAEGAVWLSARASVRAGEVGPVAKLD